MGLLELCEKYFNTTNLYEVLQITEKATEKEVKKAYHKLSLKVHPDRVNDAEKLEATEKFKVLGGVHAILSDKDKRYLYDTKKTVDEDDDDVLKDKDWMFYWRLLFKKVTEESIKAYEKEYIGSDEEKKDLKNAYIAGKGDMDYIVDQVQFARSEHEPRIRGILTEMIDQGEIPAFKIFTHEPAKKRQRRHAKENCESMEAEELKESLGLNSGANSLELMIKQKQESRDKQMDSFLDNLATKYGGKSEGTKRKATAKSEATGKNKRKKK
ncbi:dnaJ homolog subfamily C member 9 [Maniola hyperantus]|uniref:dnaJ homolog subfamily C member 9 n=1 Tax=Aphantopus hyperantus TaxID=2795564 RepID=UPI00156A0A97|nr:dnaJ homolog subfamily C member 9 [Maniola hyperantus]